MKNNLAYIDQGKGIPVILLHGFCERKEIWKHFIPRLANKARVIALDLPGFGENVPIEDDITVEDVASQVAGFMKSIAVQQAIVVGHSLGGYITLALAEHYPQLFSGLCLFHSTAKADSAEKKAKRGKTVTFLQENGIEPFAQNFVPSLFAKENHKNLEPQIAEVKKMVIHTTVKTAIAYTKAMRNRPERILVLKQAEYPCMFIAGKEDEAVPYEDMVKQSKLPQGYKQLISLEKCAHMGLYEQEKTSLDALSNFVELAKSIP